MSPWEKGKERLSKAGTWIWNHKKWVVLAIATTAGVILVVKKRSAIKELLQTFSYATSISDSHVIAKESKTSISADVLNHRTGKMLTATKLGDKTGVSNREINRRLVATGLSERLPCGDYILTEKGKLLGESGLKVTPWNYTVQLIQWDEAVLEIIFTPEELTATTMRSGRSSNEKDNVEGKPGGLRLQ